MSEVKLEIIKFLNFNCNCHVVQIVHNCKKSEYESVRISPLKKNVKVSMIYDAKVYIVGCTIDCPTK